MGRRNRRLSSLFHFTSFLVRVSQPYASLISASLISASLISCVQGRDADKGKTPRAQNVFCVNLQ